MVCTHCLPPCENTKYKRSEDNVDLGIEVMDDRYAPPFCSCGCHAPRPPKPIESPPHEPCCCCDYNPFSDNSKESEIYDLPFALRKLTVMKCQMKKWRMERLQLESENRSLKQALRSFGIDVPLHSRTFPCLPLLSLCSVYLL
ncbi:uncharacterized protein LOC105195820 [Solenopsis invicta]|uniref:uncharacterized protein LOC105195820 n=1 Tax=Solenopsis invicta TaxID=13686 RepID=UPI00193CD896|nr:uncharacterized protein LOC105195820 [Solenopsis invicta]